MIKYFIKGLFMVFMFMILAPILLPFMAIDLILWAGGADPLSTPIRKFIDRLPL